MATLTASPNTWNLAYAPNIYTLSGLAGADAYVIKVYEGSVSGNLIATYKNPANPAGVAHFDVSRALQSYLEASYVEGTSELAPTPTTALTYQVRYGTETNGVFDPSGAAAIKHVLNGYPEWRVQNWDFTNYIPDPDIEYCLCEGPECLNNAQYTRSYEFLTNWPTTNASGIKKYKVRSDEYKTLSFFTRILDWNNGEMWGPNEGPFFIKYNYFNASGSLLASDIKTISGSTGLDIRTDCTDYLTHDYTNSELVATIGVGPQNIKDGSFYYPPSGVASYNVEIWSINACYINDNGNISDCDDLATLEEYFGHLIYTAEFQIDDYCQKFEPITISFMNSFGVKDYFTLNKRNTYTTSVTRNNYKQTLGSWSDASWSIDQHGRGRRTFSTMANTQMTLSSDWMTDIESKWLEELFTSPSAMIYINGDWEPVVIMSAEYQQMTAARNNMFQHEITIQFANDKNIQRG